MRIFLVVMLPINGLMLFLFLGNTPLWMKASAAFVIALSLISFFKGYVRRLVLTEKGPRLVRLFHDIEIPWSQVGSVSKYIPGGGVGATEYVYITVRQTLPEGKWDIDQNTIQMQNQPGLLEAIEKARQSAMDNKKSSADETG